MMPWAFFVYPRGHDEGTHAQQNGDGASRTEDHGERDPSRQQRSHRESGDPIADLIHREQGGGDRGEHLRHEHAAVLARGEGESVPAGQDRTCRREGDQRNPLHQPRRIDDRALDAVSRGDRQGAR